ncbi:Type VI secretion system sheath protein TssB1 (Sheath protein HsiB1) [Durusdinium trenchii]|uniref:Type VI secretion system sheath protein TssB1 (Sheath protein HsiB1) n=1 Tax=Durusdinium trenchii TaxID=1381693 RepID=A0ABP0MY19_9DINO
MSESVQQKLSRVRKPRVHITYEVETEGASVVKELPFVVGVVADLSGQPTTPLKPLRERKFVQIDRDNFNDVMAKMTPGVEVRVKNVMSEEDSEMGVQLKFNSMDDFEPGAIVEQVESLKSLLATRNRLRDLLTRVDRSEDLEHILEQTLQDADRMTELASALSSGGNGNGNGKDKAAKGKAKGGKK